MGNSFGEYSVVNYIHPLRGERVNLGVLVWHPSGFPLIRVARNLHKVRCVDEEIDLERVRRGLEEINDTIQNWGNQSESPLGYLADRFQRGLVVSSPLHARIQDASFTLDRLYSCLVSPEPFMRSSSTTQFSKAFVSQLRLVLGHRQALQTKFDFIENETFEPVKVAAWYTTPSNAYLWRVFSFASLNEGDAQITAAKAVHAENVELKNLAKYAKSRLQLAIQMPKPAARAGWDHAMKWLERSSNQVEVFEDRNSLESKVPEILSVA